METVSPMVPEMDQYELISENSDGEVNESDEEGEFDERKAQEIFDDYMVSLPLDQRRMLDVILTLRGLVSHMCDRTGCKLFKVTTPTNLGQSPKGY